MIVNITLKNGIEEKHIVDTIDAGKAIIESYGKQHKFECRFAEGFITIASRGPGKLLALAQYRDALHVAGRACIWSK